MQTLSIIKYILRIINTYKSIIEIKETGCFRSLLYLLSHMRDQMVALQISDCRLGKVQLQFIGNNKTKLHMI